MRRGLQATHLKDEVFTPGQAVSMQVAGKIPPKRRIHAVQFSLLSDITQPAAGAAAQLGSVLPQLIALLTIGRRVSLTGLALKFHEWMKAGKWSCMAAGFPAGVSTVFSRIQQWTLWLSDPSCLSPNDGAVASELFTDDLQVRFGTTAIFAPTVPASIGNTVFRATLWHEADSDPMDPALGDEARVVPQSRVIKSVNKNDLSPVVNQVGAIPYAAIFREAVNDPGTINSTQILSATAFVDAEPVRTDVRVTDVASEFNRVRSDGTSYTVESQTVPIGGEQILDLPAPAAAAGQVITGDFFPFLFPKRGYKMSQVPRATQGFSANISGSLGAYTIVFEAVEGLSEEMVHRAANKLMPGKRFRFRPKTFSKSDLNAKGVGRYLPIRIEHLK